MSNPPIQQFKRPGRGFHGFHLSGQAGRERVQGQFINLGLYTPGGSPVQALERLFRECGLPDAIRSDNGVPFASTGIHGLCELNVWWMKLAIVHQRITPASPQENGAHERMHRTMKDKTTRPPAANLRGQQWKLDDFQKEYNVERPHEALDDETPASLWLPSPRPYPERVAQPWAVALVLMGLVLLTNIIARVWVQFRISRS